MNFQLLLLLSKMVLLSTIIMLRLRVQMMRVVILLDDRKDDSDNVADILAKSQRLLNRLTMMKTRKESPKPRNPKQGL